MVPDAVRGAVIAVWGRASRRLAGRAAGDLGFYETTFLIMQKKIFEDQAAMHEAYLAGGAAQIEEFCRAIIDVASLEAWRQIEGYDNDSSIFDPKCSRRGYGPATGYHEPETQ